jgi:hypothetical protein
MIDFVTSAEIRNLLALVHPWGNISKDGVDKIKKILWYCLRKIVKSALSTKKTKSKLTIRDAKNGSNLFLTGDVLTHALYEAQKAVDRHKDYYRKGNKLNIQFSPERIGNAIMHDTNITCSKATKLFICIELEYLATEILELSGKILSIPYDRITRSYQTAGRKTTISAGHVTRAIAADVELKHILQD